MDMINVHCIDDVRAGTQSKIDELIVLMTTRALFDLKEWSITFPKVNGFDLAG
jgi:hypothetical protein